MNTSTKIVTIVVVIIVIVAAVGIYVVNSGDTETDDDDGTDSSGDYPKTITDAYGYEVTIESEPQTFAAEVRGLNVIAYLGEDIVNRCILSTSGVSNGAQPRNGNIINLAYDITSICDTIESSSMVDMPEEVIAANPDIVIIGIGSISDTAATFKEALEAAGIPVVFTTTDSSSFTEVHEYLEMNLTVVAQVFNMEERAEEVIAQTDQWISELQDRMTGITEDEKKYVYFAGGTGKGTGFLATGSNSYYYPSIYIEDYIINIFEDLSDAEYGTLDFEDLYEYERTVHVIDYIFIDEARAWSDFESTYATSLEKYEELYAFQNDSVYIVMPFQSNGMIADNCIILAYLYSSLLYPDRFTDFDINEFALEVWTFFTDSEELGQKVYNARIAYMAEDVGYDVGFFGKIDKDYLLS